MKPGGLSVQSWMILECLILSLLWDSPGPCSLISRDTGDPQNLWLSLLPLPRALAFVVTTSTLVLCKDDYACDTILSLLTESQGFFTGQQCTQAFSL